MGGFTVNKNRYVTIIKDSISDNSGNTWHYNLTNCLKAYKNQWDSVSKNIEDDGKTDATSFMNRMYKNANADTQIDLLMEDGFPNLSMNNTYGHPIGDFFNKSVSVGGFNLSINSIGQRVSDIEGTLKKSLSSAESINEARPTFFPWIGNIPAMNMDSASLKPISFTYKFKFRLGQYGLWNAEEEVVKPILNLFAPCAPKVLSNATITPNIPTVNQLLGNVILNLFRKGSLLGINDEKELANNILNKLYNAYKPMSYTITFGNLYTFNQMMFDSVNSLSFSNEVDENGFPIQGEIEIKFTGLMPITLASNVNENRMIALQIKSGGTKK